MSTIVIGDLHGRHDVLTQVLEEYFNHDIVCVGDYLDSYDKPVEDQIKTLKMVVELAEERPQSFFALEGNHDRSYLYGESCSGYKNFTQFHVDGLGVDRIKKALKPFIWHEGFLITHAGVNSHMLNHYELTVEEYLTKKELWPIIGTARGGFAKYSGHFWCDFFEEFEPIQDVKQIFGHTGWRPSDFRGAGILAEEGNILVDCLSQRRQVLLINNGEYTPIVLEESEDAYVG